MKKFNVGIYLYLFWILIFMAVPFTDTEASRLKGLEVLLKSSTSSSLFLQSNKGKALFRKLNLNSRGSIQSQQQALLRALKTRPEMAQELELFLTKLSYYFQ